MRTRILLGFLFTVLLLPCATFGQIYEWVDKNGIKHYSSDPPPEGIEVYRQTEEIQTDDSQVAEQEEVESDQQNLGEQEPPAPESEAPPEQSAGAPAEPAPSDTVDVEDDEREAFHRERIKRRTRQNTSPAPSLENRQKGETTRIQLLPSTEESDAAR